MTTFANGESGLSVRTKINNVLQHMDGTAGELAINEAGADVDFRVESDTNANALFVDGATGNVGIGTSSVSSVFGTTVKVFSSGSGGTLDVGGSTVNARLFGSEGLSIAGFGTSTNHPFILFTNDTERLRVNSSGNVGIGTSSPAAKLVVNTATALASVPAVGSNAGLFVATVGAQDYGLISGALNDGSYFFQSQTTNGTSATYPILLNPNGGNVGIGTTSPNAASIVDAQSTTKGVRFPNMTTTQKNAIANVAGNVIFDTTLGKLCVNTGSGWQTITSA